MSLPGTFSCDWKWMTLLIAVTSSDRMIMVFFAVFIFTLLVYCKKKINIKTYNIKKKYVVC